MVCGVQEPSSMIEESSAPEKNPEGARPGRGWRLLRWSLQLFALLLLVVVVGSGAGWVWFKQEILSTLPPTLGSDSDFRIPCAVQVYADGGEMVDEFYLERRIWVPIDALPPYVWQAFVASEDRRFFEHEGVDPWGILRALAVNLQGGAVQQGGSTITQQLVKNLLVGKERSYRRKLREAVLAYRLEKELTKMQLLELYINYIALGSGNYGVEAASRDYFGVSAADLDPGQAALLAGLVPAPSRYSPRHDPELAASRREVVLKLMAQQGFIDPVVASRHLQDPITTPRRSGAGGRNAAYLTEVRREVRRLFGSDFPFQEGFQVQTPLRPEIQKIAEDAVKEGLTALEQRQGRRGPVRNIPAESRAGFLRRGDGLKLDDQLQGFRAPLAGECFPVIVADQTPAAAGAGAGIVQAGPFTFRLHPDDLKEKVRAAGGAAEIAPKPLGSILQAGDVLEVCADPEAGADSGQPAEQPARPVRLQIRPWAEGAAVVLENRTGRVVALAGGYDVGLEGFIRATQAERQPGSSFKPFVYGAAILSGHRQTDIVVDGPFSMTGTNGQPWVPRNYDGSYHGPIMLRKAIALSLNTVAVRLAAEVGVEPIAKLAAGLGVRTPLRGDLTLALGSSEVTPMDMALGFSSIARGGVRIDPVYLLEVRDREQRMVGQAGDRVQVPGGSVAMPGAGQRVMPPGAAYVLADMMRNVFLNGTARRGLRPGMDYAGTTGTTSGYVDAWFVGFSPRYTVAVWIGTDGTASIGDRETGSKTALPIWSRIMDALPDVPGERLPVPEQVILLPVDGQWLAFERGEDLPGLTVPEAGEVLPPFGGAVQAAGSGVR